MTICNMGIEAGAQVALMAPDDKCFKYLENRALCPKGHDWDAAVDYWRTLYSDADAHFDKDLEFEADEIVPYVTWGTSPEDAIPITSKIPEDKETTHKRALDYMGLAAGSPIQGTSIDKETTHKRALDYMGLTA